MSAIFRHIAPQGDVDRVRKQYLEGGLAYRGIEEELGALLGAHFAQARRRNNELMADGRTIRTSWHRERPNPEPWRIGHYQKFAGRLPINPESGSLNAQP